MELKINKLCGPPDDSFGLRIKQLYNLLSINIYKYLIGIVYPYSILIFMGWV